MMQTGINGPETVLVLECRGAPEVDSNGLPVAGYMVESYDFPADVENLALRVGLQAAWHPDRSVLTTAAARWSYNQFWSAVCRVAEEVRNCAGFTPGDRIVLQLPNSIDYLAAFYGVLLADGVVVPLPPEAEPASVQRIVDSTQARAVILSAKSRRALVLWSGRSTCSVWLEESAEWLVDRPRREGNDLAAIFFTAGSTGTPKGVMLSHRNLLANAESIQQYLEIDGRERPLCVLPFYHAFGNSVLQSHLLAGAELILDGSTVFPETLLAAIRRHQATSLAAVPDLYRVLLDRSSLGQESLPSLKTMTVAGGALRKETALAVAQRIAPARMVVMYGQTEATARLAYVPHDELFDRPDGCIGRAIPGVELRVVGDDDQPVAAGETGELVARGENIMLGYWQDETATGEKLQNGWLRTGDLASQDAAGWIYHRGRANSILKIAGFRVQPADLEEFALRRLSAAGAVAVPFESPRVGTRLALFLCLSKATAGDATATLSPLEMVARCRAELPRALVPDLIRVISDFPLNPAMKVDRLLLSQLAQQDPTHQSVSA